MTPKKVIVTLLKSEFNESLTHLSFYLFDKFICRKVVCIGIEVFDYYCKLLLEYGEEEFKSQRYV